MRPRLQTNCRCLCSNHIKNHYFVTGRVLSNYLYLILLQQKIIPNRKLNFFFAVWSTFYGTIKDFSKCRHPIPRCTVVNKIYSEKKKTITDLMHCGIAKRAKCMTHSICCFVLFSIQQCIRYFAITNNPCGKVTMLVLNLSYLKWQNNDMTMNVRSNLQIYWKKK